MSAQAATLGTIANGSVQTIAPELLLQEIRSGVPLVVLDVRDREQVYAGGAIPGARSIPLHQLGRRIEELSERRCTLMVVVSQNGDRSRTGVVTLRLAGFTELMTLEGGMARWIELGYPVERRGPESSHR